jgi:magnesium transporter
VGTALLFDRDQVDEVEDWTECVDRLGRRSILWIDLDRPDAQEIDEVVERLELSRETKTRLMDGEGRPYFDDFESYVHATAFVPARNDAASELVKVECLVSQHWVVTVHERPVEVFDEFRERAGGSGEIGRLDGPEFLADLLEWVLEAYLAAFEDVEVALEDLDARAMEQRFDDLEDELRTLVELRRKIGRLRRALVSHRGMFLALTHPELDAITGSHHAERFTTLRDQLETVVQAARDSRESVVGSFEVLIARTEQRTNEVMKALTLGALLFLPGALIAGVMGMNFKIGLFETGWYFWVVCAVICGLAIVTLVLARLRRWV